MQWWNDFVHWFYSDAGSHVFSTVIIPGAAILVAGIIGALIGRGSTKRIVSLHDRAERTAVVTAMIGAARRAANWNSLSVPEQQQADNIALECDVRLRLLPVTGAGMAAEWSAHELAELKKQAVSFSFQASQSLKEFKSRLLDWQARPSRAKRLFKNDLDSWAYDASQSDQDLIAQQQAWEAQQAATLAPVAPETLTTPETAVTATRPELPENPPAVPPAPTSAVDYPAEFQADPPQLAQETPRPE